MTDHLQQPTLVLGGTGKTGRRVVQRLVAHGVPTRVGSRAGEPPFDWEEQATWAPALSEVERVYLSYYPDLAVPGAAETVRAFTELAARTGVRRIVLLSGRGEEAARVSEQTVRDCGVDSTILRCTWFCQNFSEDFMLDAVLSGEVALPADRVTEPFVDADDIADVAFAALTGDGHAGELYELTGPRLLSFADAVGEIASAAGRHISYVPLSVEEYVAALTEYGLPPQVVALIGYLFSEVLDGRNEHLTDGVQRALGRAPRDFADYARDAAATGVWSVPAVAGERAGAS